MLSVLMAWDCFTDSCQHHGVSGSRARDVVGYVWPSRCMFASVICIVHLASYARQMSSDWDVRKAAFLVKTGVPDILEGSGRCLR